MTQCCMTCLSCNMYRYVKSSSFFVTAGSIQAKKNLDTHTERRHTLDIQINDKYNDPTTKKLIVKVKGILIVINKN